MPLHGFAVTFIRASLSTTLGASFAIIVGVLAQEDIATVAVGILAAQHLIPIPVAIVSLIIGTILNDFVLYGLGRLAITWPRLHRWMQDKKRLPLHDWLQKRLVATVITTQFLPGMRLPVFGACGMFELPFRVFALSVIGVVVIWSPLVFTCAYFYGVYTMHWLGLWRWPVALIAVIAVTMIGRAYWTSLMQRKDE
jgi:membrane protein DedA with SNARE-associated domain